MATPVSTSRTSQQSVRIMRLLAAVNAIGVIGGLALWLDSPLASAVPLTLLTMLVGNVALNQARTSRRLAYARSKF